ncbi:hypothetical protein ACHAPI_008276 [Fusarium lateritium]
MATSTSNLYGEYNPSRALAIVVCVVFIVLSLVQTWRIIRTRRRFGFTIVIGGLFEIAGLAARIYSCNHLSDQGSYGAQILLILLAPIFFAASIYMFLGRLIASADHSRLCGIRTRWLSKFFVVGDVLCFLIQLCGAGIFVSADNTSEQTDGENVILAGLALQVVILIIFIIFAVVFDVTGIKKGYPGTINPNSRLLPKMVVLYLCSTLIMCRNIFRLVEFGQGEDGYLLAHEWPVYVLDIMFMAFVMVLTLGWYSGEMRVEKSSPALQPMSEAA